MITIRKYGFFLALFLLSATAWAQEWDVPPPLNSSPPPWATPVPSMPTDSMPGVPSDNFSTPMPTPEPFDYFEDEDGMDWGGGGMPSPNKANSERKGQSSFRLLNADPDQTCNNWGHALLGPKNFTDKGSCEFELVRKVDRGKANIEDGYGQFEDFKLKKVIKGYIASRSEAEKYKISFQSLQQTLQKASQKGCTCQD